MPSSLSEEIVLAVEALRRGEVIAYPTETFYGLGVDALDPLALARLLQIKGRFDKTISVLVGSDDPEAQDAMIGKLCPGVPPLARRLMARYWPGPLTIAVPARPDLPEPLIADGCVALRDSPHPTARALIAAFGAPLTATSANPTGAPPATTAAEVEAAFDARCHVLDGGATPGGEPSTVVRVRGNRLEILRRGALQIALDDLSR